jgi:hypothetical protein
MGKMTSLITGSNAKIKINGITLAYATDVQYDVSVQTIPIETMGRYEVLANEPIATLVSGSFSIVRYTKAAKDGDIQGAAQGGNGIGNWGDPASGEVAAKGMSSHINPGYLLNSKTVDIELFRKSKNDPSDAGTKPDSELFLKIKDARLTRMSGSVNKRGVLMESFTFVAEMIQNDSFEAVYSGEADLGT